MSEVESSRVGRASRRLSDKILHAFHHACDYQDYSAAEELLRVAEGAIVRHKPQMGGQRRNELEHLVAAHARLWYLRHQVEE